jgi:hypothetical protein
MATNNRGSAFDGAPGFKWGAFAGKKARTPKKPPKKGKGNAWRAYVGGK